MSIVKINALTVPEGAGETLEERFSHRLHAVDDQPGFEGFQLLRPTAGEDRYFVVTWWADEKSYDDWVHGQDFARSHGDVADANKTGHGAHDVHASGGESHGASESSENGDAARRPAAVKSEVLEFDVVLDSTK